MNTFLLRRTSTWFVLLSLLLRLSFVQAQDNLDNFTTIKSQGDLPQCFTTLSVDKFKDDIESIDRKEGQFYKKKKADFYLQSNFMIDNILHSGKITYGDPVTEYLDDIVDYLLKDHKELRDRIQIFTSKTPYLNAFATDQGIIFVNTGLIARMHTEAELAFVLSHEITHIDKDHIMDMHIEKEEMFSNRGKYRRVDIDNYLLNINTMSIEHELEADRGAYLNFYRQSNYSLSQLDTTFESLLHSDKAFSDVEFDLSYFETDYYKFPSEYKEDSIQKNKGSNVSYTLFSSVGEKNTGSTHPEPLERKEKIARLKFKDSDEGREDFVISEERFIYARNLCRLESIRQMMISMDYIPAIYNCYALLQELPDNKFLKQTLAAALYIHSRYLTHEDLYSISYSPDTDSKQVDKLAKFLNNMKAEEATMLALKYIEGFSREYGRTKYMNTLTRHLLEDLFLEHDIQPEELILKEDIQRKPELQESSPEELYYLFAFADFDKDTVFDNMVTEVIKEQEEKRKKDHDFEALSYKMQDKKEKIEDKKERKEERKNRLNGESHGIDKVAIVDPFFYKIRPKRKEAVRLIDSEKGQLQFSNRIKKCGDESGIDYTILNPKEFNTSDLDNFNNLSFLNDWFDERLEHTDDFEVIPYLSGFVDNTKKELSTSNVMWTGVIAEKKLKQFDEDAAVVCLYSSGCGLPFLLIWRMTPSYKTTYFSLVYDIGTGEIINATQKYLKIKSPGSFVNAMTYDTFYQLKNKDSE